MSDETMAARIIGLYQRHGEVWAARRGRSLFEKPWLDRFSALLPPEPDVLDLGCGSGDPIARHFAAQGARITGVDSAPKLLSRAQDLIPDGTFHLGDMRSLSLNQSFDGILAWNSFFHLTPDDQRRMFPVFQSHAAPGAALMFTSGPGAGEAIGTLMGEPLYHASLAPEEYEDLLGAHGFDLIAHQAEDPECNQHTVWLSLSADT